MADVSPSTIASLIRDVADFPEPGVMFKDIMPLLADGAGLEMVAQSLAVPWADERVDLVAGIEARGFILAPLVARVLGAGFLAVRKAGKLPGAVHSQSYDLEYGTDAVEIQVDALATGCRTLVIDDVLATGGTAAATGRLIRSTGAEIVGFGFLIELAFLNGREKLVDDELSTRQVKAVIIDHGSEE